MGNKYTVCALNRDELRAFMQISHCESLRPIYHTVVLLILYIYVRDDLDPI